MVKKTTQFTFLIVCLFVVVSFVFISFVGATECWEYSENSTCDSNSNCLWKSDSWGGWCQELNCYSLWTQDECSTTSVPNKECRWKDATSYGWCEQTSCYSFWDTNQTYCENSTVHGLNCEWDAQCRGYNPEVDCWYLNETSCGNTTGCNWGDCMSVGCWNYQAENTCDGQTGSQGNACEWKTDTWGSWCGEVSCWGYGGTNQTYCEANPASINCVWVNNYYTQSSCEEPSCWHYDNTNSTACISNTQDLNCTWDGQYCMTQGCWNYGDSSTCDGVSGCNWQTSSGSGWCEELQCWSYDTWGGGNESHCVNSTLNGGLECEWTNDTWAATEGDGWCFQSMDLSCANFTIERDCMDTYYCWWEYVDWMDASAGGNCKDPFSDFGQTNGTFFDQWNPGCYIFDMNETDCNKVVGCNYSLGACNTTGNNDNLVVNITFDNLNNDGLNCTMLNDSQLCNKMPMLSTCCEWNAGSCQTKLGKECWDDAEREQDELGVEACEDVSMQTSDAASAKTLCEQVAGFPLYMPCEWTNTTNTCSFKSEDVFGNRTASLALIENKNNCQAAGGKWIEEWYCEGNRSVPAGRCEQKGDDEKNCDKACFACEYTFEGAVHNSSQVAEEYCYDSKLGYCEFVEDLSAPNGFGFCNAKEEFKKGIATDCNLNCGSCTYMGNPNAGSAFDGLTESYGTCNTPDCYCRNADEFSNVKCKWVNDTSSNLGGYCADSSEKTCNDACDRCYTRTKCLEDGRQSLNLSGSCEWLKNGEVSTDETDGACSQAGQTLEICWDGVDNDNDNLIDCADSGCFSDSFCGFVGTGFGDGDCFGKDTQTKCEATSTSNGLNCTWITDPWGSWCDFPGSDCWKLDGNVTGCGNSSACDWSIGAGNGWCEQDWNLGQDCYGQFSFDGCSAVENCTWTNDTWCEGDGNTTDWCITQGGWCDPTAFAPKNCWSYDDTDSSTCEAVAGCYWDDPWCFEEGCWNYDSNQTACAEASDCGWESSDWQSCEVDWSGDCWKYNNESYCSTNGCAWKSGDWGNWCDSNLSVCWDRTTQSTCESDSSCFWDSQMWNWMTNTQGNCQPACYNSSIDSLSECTAVSGCKWNDGWCMSNQMSGGGAGGIDCWEFTNDTHEIDSLTCANTQGCNWKNPGWCDPKGFSGGGCSTGVGGGASTGMECWKFDGNQSACTDSSATNMTCSWMPESWAFCEPDWSSDCWRYYDNITLDSNGYVCGNVSGCMWNAEQDYCTNVFDQCWNNQTLNSDETACDENQYCNWTAGFGEWAGDGWCEPTCFQASTEGECDSSCRWMDGWCNSPGMYSMFEGMESGVPVMVATDDCAGEISPNLLDLCGVGVKDMGDSFGIGASVNDFSEAGVCNQEKVGFGNNFGQGNQTIKYYVYLDTDGETTGGCALSSDASALGYEFFFKYTATYNTTLGKITESFTAKKCGSSGWTIADIGLNAWKQKMCSETQGPMIAVEKTNLEKFPSLYSSEQNMRVYASIAGEDNNATIPSDSVGPGWFTPGAIDFNIDGFFEYGADFAMFEDIFKTGFVEYEDCYNEIDDDNDGLIDCDDWDCEFMPKCAGLGVNADNYVDSSMPRIVGIKIEEYPDSALIMYDTDKPTNGTLYFWFNDSTCSSNIYNRTIADSTSLSTVRSKTSWHYAHIYNDAGVSSLDYDLENATTYYYKIEVCDSGDKCSKSGCTELRTANSVSNCGYCNFVTIISAPSGWNVSYDLNANDVYEHNQGQVCGPSAGMKTNYTDGRKANIKLSKADGSVYFEFLNATLTKTSLTSDTRDIAISTDLIYETSEGYVGMPADTRDKIINNLHPESCRLKIPSSGTCDKLYHCDDSGDNCQDRTSEATLIDVDNCVWQLPYCEFSTWDEDGNPSSGGDSSSSSGGGGGGGGGGGAVSFIINSSQFLDGYSNELAINYQIVFTINDDLHLVKLIGLTASTASINVSSVTQQAVLSIGDSRRFEITDDKFYDVKVTLNSINLTTNKADITIISISEEVVPDSITEEKRKERDAIEKKQEEIKEEIKKNRIKILAIVLAVIIVAVIAYFIRRFVNRNKGIKKINKK